MIVFNIYQSPDGWTWRGHDNHSRKAADYNRDRVHNSKSQSRRIAVVTRK